MYRDNIVVLNYAVTPPSPADYWVSHLLFLFLRFFLPWRCAWHLSYIPQVVPQLYVPQLLVAGAVWDCRWSTKTRPRFASCYPGKPGWPQGPTNPCYDYHSCNSCNNFYPLTARLVIRQIPRLQGHDSPWLVLGDGRGCVGLERQFAFLKHFFWKPKQNP